MEKDEEIFEEIDELFEQLDVDFIYIAARSDGTLRMMANSEGWPHAIIEHLKSLCDAKKIQ